MAVASCVEKNEQSITSFIDSSGVDSEEKKGEIGDTLFVLQTPVWGPDSLRPMFNWPFSQPRGVYVGREPLIYVADTGNDRIVMLDTFGNIKGYLEGIPHPVDMTQDPRLRLYIVNETSTIYFVDLFKYGHNLEVAQIDSIFGPKQEDNDCEHRPTDCWQFVGISAYKNDIDEDELYLASTGPRQRNRMIHQFSLDTSRADQYKGPLPLVSPGFGFFGIIEPTGITEVRFRSFDFIYTQKGVNTFKVQWITQGSGETSAIEAFLDPRFGADIFQTRFREPEDAATDENQNVYVVDAAADSMYKYSASGKLLQTLGPTNPAHKRVELTPEMLLDVYEDSLTALPVLQKSIELIAVSASDTTLLMTDIAMGRIEGWAGSGTIDYETGALEVSFNDTMRSEFPEGTDMLIDYIAKGLNNPQGISVFDKIIYIADTGNNRIVRYKLSTDID